MAGNLQVDGGAVLIAGGVNVDTVTIASGGLLQIDNTADNAASPLRCRVTGRLSNLGRKQSMSRVRQFNS